MLESLLSTQYPNTFPSPEVQRKARLKALWKQDMQTPDKPGTVTDLFNSCLLSIFSAHILFQVQEIQIQVRDSNPQSYEDDTQYEKTNEQACLRKQ